MQYKQFESIIIIDDTLSEQEATDTAAKYQNKIEMYNSPIEKYNGQKVEVNNMGLKALAYTVKGHEKGYFCTFNFWATDENIKELEELYRADDLVIKYMCVRRESDVIDLDSREDCSLSPSHPKINLMDILLADDTDA